MDQLATNGVHYGVFKDTRFGPASGNAEKRLVLLIPGQGCVPWLATKGECCTFCRLPAGTRYAVMGDGFEEHFEPWKVNPSDYATMIDTALADSAGVDKITVFNGGSFLTDREIPKTARQHLYRRFAEHATATELMVESRPEFVKADMLDEMQDITGDKSVMIGIGLESMDDHVRNNVLKKFIGRKSFVTSIETLQKRGLKTFVYVFLGAPGLTEHEAYLDARASIQALHAMGVDEIALSCAFVPPGGQLEQLYRKGEFRPPRLWTIAHLVEEARAKGWPLTVGGFDDFPPPIAVAENCGNCDPTILAAFDRHRETGAFQCDTTCTCKQSWDAEMELVAV